MSKAGTASGCRHDGTWHDTAACVLIRLQALVTRHVARRRVFFCSNPQAARPLGLGRVDTAAALQEDQRSLLFRLPRCRRHAPRGGSGIHWHPVPAHHVHVSKLRWHRRAHQMLPRLRVQARRSSRRLNSRRSTRQPIAPPARRPVRLLGTSPSARLSFCGRSLSIPIETPTKWEGRGGRMTVSPMTIGPALLILIVAPVLPPIFPPA